MKTNRNHKMSHNACYAVYYPNSRKYLYRDTRYLTSKLTRAALYRRYRDAVVADILSYILGLSQIVEVVR